MSGYGPYGWSTSLNFARRLMRSPRGTAAGAQVIGGSPGLVMLGWLILRLALGVNQGLAFELLGAFILSQTGFKSYDWATHRNAHAIVFIGSTGGIAMGIALVLVDAITSNSRALGDVEPPIRPGRAARAAPLHNPNAGSARNQAALRMILWPGLAALGGVVGVLLYHLAMNSKPEPNAGARAGTGAIVQVVGAAVSVSAPSLIQLLTLLSSGNKK